MLISWRFFFVAFVFLVYCLVVTVVVIVLVVFLVKRNNVLDFKYYKIALQSANIDHSSPPFKACEGLRKDRIASKEKYETVVKVWCFGNYSEDVFVWALTARGTFSIQTMIFVCLLFLASGTSQIGAKNSSCALFFFLPRMESFKQSFSICFDLKNASNRKKAFLQVLAVQI